MKILFLSRRFYPDIGGVEKHVFELSKSLIALGNTVTVISEGNSDSRIKRFEKQTEINIYKINVSKNQRNKKFIIWKWLLKNKQLIHDADIIHCHDVFYWYLPFRFLYPSKPIYTTFHGYESFPIKKKAIIVRKISEKLSWGNICIGDFIKKWYGTNPTYVSYGAVDSSKFKEQSAKFSKESAVFIGRLDEQTGILTYNKAFEKLINKFPKFEFLIVGDGKYKNKISKKAKTIGFKKNPEKYFNNYRFAFVSRYLSILEAFAAKKLVFAVYDNPVKEDYLKMAPYANNIFISNTADELTKQIENVVKNPLIENIMVEKAYKWVKKQTWKEMVNLYFKLWGIKKK